MVYVDDGPAHPFKDGVKVMVAEITVPVEFVEVKLGIFPVPLAASPIAVFELVQVKPQPAWLLIKFVDGMFSPAQTLILSGIIREGIGFTVMV